MDDNKTLYTASLCLAASLALVWKWRQNRNKPPYPPGPKGYPLIGNILDVPQDVPVWQGFIPMARKFSERPFDLWLDVIITEEFFGLRYGRVISETTYNRFRRFEQHRSHHGLVGETV